MMRNSKKLLVSALIGLTLVGIPAYAALHGGHGLCHERSGHKSDHGMEMIGPELREQLQFTPAQEKTWQDITSRIEASHTQKRDDRAKLKDTFRQELAKAETDLAKISELNFSLRERNLQSWKDIQTQQINLYTSLSTEQKAMVKKVLLERMEHKHKPHDEVKHEG